MEFPYKRDSIWMNYLLPESKIHGARYNIHLLIDLIEMYSKEGDTVLDVMGGIGSIFVALTMKRNVYMIELEPRFAVLARQNLAYIKEKYDTSNSIGVVIEGDNRILLPLPVHTDVIITSPPYGDAMRKSDASEIRLVERLGSTTAQGYSDESGKAHPSQIGNMPYEQQYWILRDVYGKCYDTLAPGGHMIVVTKNIIKAGKVLDINQGTVATCTDVGFHLEGHHVRLCQMTGMQGQHKHDPNYKPVLYEDINIFRVGG